MFVFDGAGPVSLGSLLVAFALLVKTICLFIQAVVQVHAVVYRGADAVYVGSKSLVGDPLTLFVAIDVVVVLACLAALRSVWAVCRSRGVWRAWRTSPAGNAATWLVLAVVLYDCLQRPCAYRAELQTRDEGVWRSLSYLLIVAQVLRDLLSALLLLAFLAVVAPSAAAGSRGGVARPDSSERTPLLLRAEAGTLNYGYNQVDTSREPVHPVLLLALWLAGVAQHVFLAVGAAALLTLQTSDAAIEELPSCRSRRSDTLLLMGVLVFHALLAGAWWVCVFPRSHAADDMEIAKLVMSLGAGSSGDGAPGRDGAGTGELTFRGRNHSLDLRGATSTSLGIPISRSTTLRKSSVKKKPARPQQTDTATSAQSKRVTFIDNGKGHLGGATGPNDSVPALDDEYRDEAYFATQPLMPDLYTCVPDSSGDAGAGQILLGQAMGDAVTVSERKASEELSEQRL